MRILLWTAGVVAALVLAAVVALPVVANGDAVRQRVSDAVRDLTGRTLTFGNVSISLPTLSLVVDDVRLSGEAARIGAVALSLDARALLRGELEIAGITVSDPRIAIDAGGASAPGEEGEEEAAPTPGQAGAGRQGAGGVKVSLRSFRVERGALSVRDAAGRETFAATDIAIDAVAPAPDRPVSVTGRLTLSRRPVAFAATLGTLDAVLSGAPFALEATLESGATTARYEGSAGMKPVAFDGEAILDTASVAELLTWAGRPLPEGSPDPGPLRFAARFAHGEGGAVEVTEATLTGEGVEAGATGRIDVSGAAPEVRLTVEAGRVDLDRYLPLPAPAPAPPSFTASAESAAAPAPGGLSTEPFDPGLFGVVEGEVSLRADTVRFGGEEAGPVDIAVATTGAGYRAALRQLGLDGGTLSGDAKAERADGALALEAALSFDGIPLARAAEGVGGGNVSGKAVLSGAGAHLRALVESLAVAIDASLTDAAFSAPQLAGLSSLSLTARARPGSRTEVAAELVYGGAPAKVAVTLDPLLALAEGDGSDIVATVDTDVLDARWDGAALWRPAPEFDGALKASAASVAALAARLGRPLPEDKPDPGALSLDGALGVIDSRIALTGATLRADAFTATGDADVDVSSGTPRVTAALEVDGLDIEALAAALASRPARSVAAAAPSGDTADPSPQRAAPAAWSDEPIALDGLRAVDADVRIRLSDARYRGLVLDRGDLSLRLDGGVARVEAADGALAGGTVAAAATVDGSGETLGIDYALDAAGVSVRPLLVAFADTDELSGRLDFSMRGASAGASPNALVSGLNGDGALTLADGALAGLELEGVDIAGLLHRAVASIIDEPGDGPPRTVFDSLHGAFSVANGEVVNEDMVARAPLFGLSGSGRASLPRRTVDYRVVAALAARAGGDNILAGIPIPVGISGPWTEVEYEVAWDGVLAAVASDPARVAALPAGVAIGAAELGIELPAGLVGGALGVLEAVGEALSRSDGAGAPAEEGRRTPTLPLPVPDPVELLGDLLGR